MLVWLRVSPPTWMSRPSESLVLGATPWTSTALEGAAYLVPTMGVIGPMHLQAIKGYVGSIVPALFEGLLSRQPSVAASSIAPNARPSPVGHSGIDTARTTRLGVTPRGPVAVVIPFLIRVVPPAILMIG